MESNPLTLRSIQGRLIPHAAKAEGSSAGYHLPGSARDLNDQQIRGHLRDWVLVLADEQRRLNGEDVMDADRIIQGVQEFLEGPK